MKTTRAFSILAGLALLVSMPLAAQYAADQSKPAVEPAAPAAEATMPAAEGQEIQKDSLDVDVDAKDAQGNIDPDIDVKTGAEARADTDTKAHQDEELPKTASPLALLALLGFGAGGSAFGLRRLRR